MKYLILCACIAVSGSLQADKLILGGISHHFEHLWYEPNERHEAIGYEWDTWEVSIYRNTLKRTSLAVAYIDRPWEWKGLKAGYRFGLASGYEPVKVEDKRYATGRRAEKPYRIKEGASSELNGFMPQAQLIITGSYKALSVDLGIGPVSTLVFKLGL